MIDIMDGNTLDGSTNAYIITTDCKTAKEFIEEWIETRPEQWGYFRIYKSTKPHTNSSVLEYKNGKIIISQNYFYDLKEFDSKIEGLHGGGIGSRSDFYILIKEES